MEIENVRTFCRQEIRRCEDEINNPQTLYEHFRFEGEKRAYEKIMSLLGDKLSDPRS